MNTLCLSIDLFVIHSLIYLLNKHEKSAYSVLGTGDVTVNRKDKETPLKYFNFSC